ncbi:MAG TPA: hypothetical protein PLM00_03160 [Spirochaetota bacterium]|nr:hypothetical protein [Spirochaetota bacterium]HPH02426.1 hypothetical protein [Spirochaetota bacterium]HPN82361.1 hypothetical protein [Spirochaetota bacterium]
MGRSSFLERTPLGGSEVERWASEYNLALFPEERRGSLLAEKLETACRMLRAEDPVSEISQATGLTPEEIDTLLY